jgi:hypothetical protein
MSKQKPRERIKTGSPNGDGGGDNTPESGSSYYDNQIKKKKRRKKYVVPPSVDTYPWGQFLVNGYRYSIGGSSIWPLVALAFVVWFWFPWRIIPGIPPALMRYGLIEYIPFIFVFGANLLVPALSRVTEMYGIYFCFNLAALVWDTWLGWVFIYNFYHCSNGDLPDSCKSNVGIDIVMSIPTAIIWLVLFFCTAYYGAIVTRTSGTTRPYVISYHQV